MHSTQLGSDEDGPLRGCMCVGSWIFDEQMIGLHRSFCCTIPGPTTIIYAKFQKLVKFSKFRDPSHPENLLASQTFETLEPKI
jgi:hypothetical protein